MESGPAMGARFTVFWACRSCGPAGWLALLLTKAGDVETNPGPTTLNKQVWICYICHKQIHVRKQISIRCKRIEHWVHLRCAGIRQAQSTDTWTCHLHRESRLTPHTNITPPHRSRPWSIPPTRSPTYITATKTQTHVQHTPCPHMIGEAQTHFSHPLTPPPPLHPHRPEPKHIRMSHTPPTTSHYTHLKHVTCTRQTPEPRVPLIHAPHYNYTSPGPHTIIAVTLAPSHSHTLTHPHATQTTVQNIQLILYYLLK